MNYPQNPNAATTRQCSWCLEDMDTDTLGKLLLDALDVLCNLSKRQEFLTLAGLMAHGSSFIGNTMSNKPSTTNN